MASNDFRERMKRLAGYKSSKPATMPERVEKRQETIVEKPQQVTRQASQSPFNKSFFKTMTSDNILNEAISKSPVLRNAMLLEKKKDTTKQAPIEKVDKSSDFMKRVAEISKIASSKGRNASASPTKSEIRDLISEQIKKSGIGMLNEADVSAQAPQNQMTMPQTPPAMPVDNQEPAGQTPPPPAEEPPQEQPPAEQPPAEKPPEEEKPKKISKNQLIGNIVKGVQKLATYANWTENLEEKYKYLVKNMKNNYGREDAPPSKNPFGALAILLSAYDQIEDERIKNVIANNYKKHLMNDENIQNFINGVWEGELADATAEVGTQEQEAQPPAEEPQPEETGMESQPTERTPPVPPPPIEETPAPAPNQPQA